MSAGEREREKEMIHERVGEALAGYAFIWLCV